MSTSLRPNIERMASTTYGTYPENHDEDHSAVGENHDDRKKDAMIAGNNEYDYDESDTSSVEVLTGVSKVEAAQAVWYVIFFSSIRLFGRC